MRKCFSEVKVGSFLCKKAAAICKESTEVGADGFHPKGPFDLNYELVCTRCLNVGKWKMAGARPIQARAETETMDQGDGMIACVVGGEEVWANVWLGGKPNRLLTLQIGDTANEQVVSPVHGAPDGECGSLMCALKLDTNVTKRKQAGSGRGRLIKKKNPTQTC